MRDEMKRHWQDFAILVLLLYLVSGFLILQGRAQEVEPAPPPIEKQRRIVSDLVYRVSDLQHTQTELKDTQTKLKAKTQDLQVKETGTEIRIALNADVLFDFDKAAILPNAQSALKQVAALIQEQMHKKKPVAVRVEGHTDAKGSDDYNQKLSERRAQAVKSWLSSTNGLNAIEFTTRGFGATKPVASNKKPDGSDDPEGRRQNRRVEIIVKK